MRVRVQSSLLAASRRTGHHIAGLALLLVALCVPASAQVSHDPVPTAEALGLARLSPPYVISTARHYAILVQFPKADSIRRIALGDSSYFLVEADKDDPHYAIVKQTRVPNGKTKTPIETNMLVYMASGMVINITLRSSELQETAYLIDYPVPKTEPSPTPAPPPPTVSPEQEALKRLSEEMVAEVNKTQRKDGGASAGGLILRLHRIERVGEMALVSFEVQNATSKVLDIEGPQLDLVTVATKGGRKKPPANVEPIQIVESVLSPRQLTPGARAIGFIQFRPPVHDSNQGVVFSVANRRMADMPAQIQIE